MNTIDRSVQLVSVIITTRNEETEIRECLDSIRNQTYTNIEIIVVDNASRDTTRNISLEYTKRVFNKGPERSAQRNYGAANAKGTYLLFLDADMRLAPTVIAECVSGIAGKTRACIIPEKSIGVGFWARCKILERTYYEGVVWMEAARFYDKKTFVSLNGFDEELTGPEDFDLSQRVRMEYGSAAISRIQSYIYHNEGTIVLLDLLRKKYYYGKKMQRYITKNENKTVSVRQASPFARYVLFLQKPQLLLHDPIYAIGMLLMKTLELGALGFGMIAGRV